MSEKLTWIIIDDPLYTGRPRRWWQWRRKRSDKRRDGAILEWWRSIDRGGVRDDTE